MPGVDPEIGNSALRLWVAAGSAALLVAVCALGFDRSRAGIVRRIAVVAVGAVLGGTLAWAFLDTASLRDRNAERRDLEMRAAQLSTQILAPGSPLACLDGVAGADVETACEKALFAAPAAVASATAYVAARLALLADIVAYTKRGGTDIDTALLPLRRSLEADRFGFVAHLLAVRDGCTSDNCKPLALLHDQSQVRANLSGQTLDRYLDRYVKVWALSPEVPLAEAAPSSAPGQAASGQAAAGQRKVLVDIDFPSAASIPPVSIMNPEPSGPPGAAAVAAATAGEAKAHDVPAAAARRARKPAAPAQAAASVPATDAPVDPVWLPGTTLAAPQPAAPAPPATASPVQLSPFPAPQQTGSASRGQ